MQLTKYIPASREDVYEAFTKPELIEQWAYPEGMTLKVPEFDARVDGRYRYIHTGDNGEYNCTGYFKEIIPNERLVTVDEKITDPEGNIIFEGLEGKVSFRDKAAGTELTVTQTGFKDAQGERDCEQGWVDSLFNLTELLDHRSPGSFLDEYSASI